MNIGEVAFEKEHLRRESCLQVKNNQTLSFLHMASSQHHITCCKTVCTKLQFAVNWALPESMLLCLWRWSKQLFIWWLKQLFMPEKLVSAIKHLRPQGWFPGRLFLSEAFAALPRLRGTYVPPSPVNTEQMNLFNVPSNKRLHHPEQKLSWKVWGTLSF